MDAYVVVLVCGCLYGDLKECSGLSNTWLCDEIDEGYVLTEEVSYSLVGGLLLVRVYDGFTSCVCLCVGTLSLLSDFVYRGVYRDGNGLHGWSRVIVDCARECFLNLCGVVIARDLYENGA